MMRELYTQIIMDHYRSPRNRGELAGAEVEEHLLNPLCGDEITVYAHVENDTVADVAFQGQGCSISQASASMLTESVRGRSVGDALALASDFRGMMAGEVDPSEEDFGDLIALKGVVKYPIRIKCAVLAWDVLQEALHTKDAASRGA